MEPPIVICEQITDEFHYNTVAKPSRLVGYNPLPDGGLCWASMSDGYVYWCPRSKCWACLHDGKLLLAPKLREVVYVDGAITCDRVVEKRE